MDRTRGQSETIGFALILGFTLISVGAIAAYGGATLDTTQAQIGAQNAEHAMSQFDSRASMVALGRSDIQTVNFGAGQQGTYTVDPDAGSIRVTHEDQETNDTTVFYDEPLGTVRYTDDDTEIGYQGGGVWRMDEGSVMLSPPEFHYRKSTLTLPIIRISGQGSVAGNPRGVVRQPVPSTVIFPNESATLKNSSEKWVNPVGGGIVTVTVESTYYRAWGEYFRTRTSGEVSIDGENETAAVELVAPGTMGGFDMPLDGNSLTLQGTRGHQVENFTLTLFHDQDDSAKFNNLDWSMCSQSGSQEFEIRVSKDTGTGDGDPAETIIYYSPDGSRYQTWKTEDFTFETEAAADADWNGDGDQQDKRLVLDFTGTATAEYFEENNVNSISNCDFDASTFESSVTFDEHPADENTTYTTGSTANVSHVTNHYLALMGPSTELEVADSSQNTVEEEISTGYVSLNTTEGYYLTYMHVTENPINVTVE
ncbi:hypothetical protein HTSR_1265 [Halodesulfurarchaeum formicicum]|uniref:DUF7308 domain-containing protein n=1 Tax=Halodesulfurarchaeum formicicum TaxID=1873524 RepID=A0A1D8S513_9EURY|nr:hypothetical protein [Halodesulfurarchaeum formicicum]AOW80442.1 hypothetical protein HTSR_1265 [Halodesulfurarchaeum formicicum]APE95781.1 hypothetical protein HSR6_1338 [Halodesulfurarchaeum formicicum]